VLWCHYCISVPLSQPTMLRSKRCWSASERDRHPEQRAQTSPKECCGDCNRLNRMGTTITHVNLETRKNMFAQQACRLVTEALLAVACFEHLEHVASPPACAPRKDRWNSAREGRERGVPLAATTATPFVCEPRLADGCPRHPGLLTGSQLGNVITPLRPYMWRSRASERSTYGSS